MPVVHGKFCYPGIRGVISAQYTTSHSISPGIILVRMQMADGWPAPQGDAVFDDNIAKFTLKGCRVNNVITRIGEDGKEMIVELQDRRWRWGFGSIFGWYNQLDPHGKLIPWTIRSPKELAILCLYAMGEGQAEAVTFQGPVNTILDIQTGVVDTTGFYVDMPEDITSAWGQGFQDFVQQGFRFPQSICQPTIWNGLPPAVALQQLCDQFGRRVVYDCLTNKVSVVRQGSGRTLPTTGLSIAKKAPELTARAKPHGGLVIGAPIKFTCRLLLQPMCEEWNGHYVPANTVSYAPVLSGTALPQIGTISVGEVFFGMLITVTINSTVVNYVVTGPDTSATVATALASLINSQAGSIVTASANGANVTLTGKNLGLAFTVSVSQQPEIAFTPTTYFTTQSANSGVKSWAKSGPPSFVNVRATDRLTEIQARALAQKSMWKVFQVLDVDVDGPPGTGIKIHGYGTLERRQQVVLQETRVAQVEPSAGDADFVNPSDQRNVVWDFYNGYSRDLPAICYARRGQATSSLYWRPSSFREGVRQVSTVTVVSVSAGSVYSINVNGFTCNHTASAFDTTATIATGLAAQVSALAASVVSATANGNVVTIIGNSVGVSFSHDATVDSFPSAALTSLLTTAAVAGSDGPNTLPGTRIQFGFSIDPNYQLVSFNQYVFRCFNSEYVDPEVILETGCYVRDPVNNQVVPYMQWRSFYQVTETVEVQLPNVIGPVPWTVTHDLNDFENFAVEYHEDVQLGIVATFENNTTNHLEEDGLQILEQDPLYRAGYYLEGMMLKFQVFPSDTKEYNGLVPIPLDGAIQQVTYNVTGSEAGTFTVASQNCEHSTVYPRYPERRRAEQLTPNRSFRDTSQQYNSIRGYP